MHHPIYLYMYTDSKKNDQSASSVTTKLNLFPTPQPSMMSGAQGHLRQASDKTQVAQRLSFSKPQTQRVDTMSIVA